MKISPSLQLWRRTAFTLQLRCPSTFRGLQGQPARFVCAFMFDYLDAAEVTSAAFADNLPSQAVSKKVGYEHNGVGRLKRRDGEMAVNQRFVVTA